MFTNRSVLLKRFLLAFWALYLTLVFSSNLFDALKSLGWLSSSWRFVSGNYSLVASTTAVYDAPPGLTAGLFAGVLCWEALAALLFWWAAFGFRGKERPGGGAAFAAMATGLALWSSFIISEEVFVSYKIESVHWGLFTAQLATLLVVELLPENS
jgi:hypothetical protein